MKTILTLLSLSVSASLAFTATADQSKEEKIQRAMSAAPESVSGNATIMDTDGTVLKKGTNGWTCLPDTMPGDGAPMCNDETWMEMLNAVMNKEDFVANKIGISYMLQGEPEGSGVSNSTPYHQNPTEAEDYVETGPHLMIIVPKKLLSGITTDPTEGGPYIMWNDTPYAHIMLPVAMDNN